MYKVTVPHKIIYVDEFRYVRMNPNSGSYIQCSEEYAEAVAVDGQLYSLPDKPPVMVTVFTQIDEENWKESTQPAPVATINSRGGQEFSRDLDSYLKTNQTKTSNLSIALTEIADSIL